MPPGTAGFVALACAYDCVNCMPAESYYGSLCVERLLYGPVSGGKVCQCSLYSLSIKRPVCWLYSLRSKGDITPDKPERSYEIEPPFCEQPLKSQSRNPELEPQPQTSWWMCEPSPVVLSGLHRGSSSESASLFATAKTKKAQFGGLSETLVPFWAPYILVAQKGTIILKTIPQM